MHHADHTVYCKRHDRTLLSPVSLLMFELGVCLPCLLSALPCYAQIAFGNRNDAFASQEQHSVSAW
ncbi:hypothetical protein QOZ95_002115 [Paenibacillus brasilensis]|uniref:Uncharacterized protein n=1 Tax=Paenibacillus brasilensis TaxID=128574 RepID=A0ABU0KWY2_9BACL|nr:hypothetical protein [Paenibacillus brasilensis]